MLISTRGRYALRVMIDLAQHRDEGYVPMKDVAERQGISLKYIGGIMPVLTKNKLVEGIHGKGGGYRLTKAPNEYKIGDILSLTEGDLSPLPASKPTQSRVRERHSAQQSDFGRNSKRL